MLRRRIESEIDAFFKTNIKSALLIIGARQIGKTYIIRDYCKSNYDNFVEINFIENRAAVDLFDNASDSDDIITRLSLLTDVPLVLGKTIIFFDEVQECKELVTAIKFLVDDGRFRYILSGSLLGVELKSIRSIPVGYLQIFDMYPLDFEEFCMANNVSDAVTKRLHASFDNKTPVDELINNKMLELFHLYLVVGGMPAAVDEYIKTKNLSIVGRIQSGIVRQYKQDIAKYDPDNKLYLDEIFELIPSELNSKNKRFIMKNLNENFKLSRYENSFIWLKEAGVALPAYCANEPTVPLILSKSTNLFKLFLSDIGLLSAMYSDGIQMKVLSNESDINCGAIYENAVAQELHAHGFNLYYFNSKKQGEVDFLIELGDRVIPIEIKSGKTYSRHHALDNLISSKEYNIENGYVFADTNVSSNGKITTYPIYFIDFIRKQQNTDDMIYDMDMSVLQ